MEISISAADSYLIPSSLGMDMKSCSNFKDPLGDADSCLGTLLHVFPSLCQKLKIDLVTSLQKTCPL